MERKGAIPKAQELSAFAQVETGVDINPNLDSVFILLEYGRMLMVVPFIAVIRCNELT